MIWGLLLFLIATLIYATIILKIRDHWSVKDTLIDNQDKETNFVSVVVCVRNEAHNVENCIQSILDNDYPKELYEVIVVNDHSEDDTLWLLESMNTEQIHIINLTDSFTGKKAGLNEGIKTAKGTIILCTDGDCTVPKSWISNFEKHISGNQLNFATSIVLPKGKPGLLHTFQLFDFMLTMAITFFGIGKKRFYLANGANMGFIKSFYMNVHGFENNKHLASGDDVFLIQEASRLDSSKVGFIKSKSSIVYTQSEKSWSDLWTQRLRWSSKMSAVKDVNLIILPAFVFLYHGMIIVLSTIFLINGSIIFPLSFIGIKMIIDYLLIDKLSVYFGMKMNLSDFVLSFFVYGYYIFLTAMHSIFPKPFAWKGRFVK